MNEKGVMELTRVFEDWRAEDQKLSTCIEEIRDWMSEVNQLGIPHFGETASRLQPLREALAMHFEREIAMLTILGELYPQASPEVLAFRRQTLADHRSLLSRLDDLHERLKEIDPRFESWTAAMDEVDVFFEAIEQHERSESDRIEMLMPGNIENEMI